LADFSAVRIRALIRALSRLVHACFWLSYVVGISSSLG
jgi:hypothetical protein